MPAGQVKFCLEPSYGHSLSAHARQQHRTGVQWPSVTLYPAGYNSRRITVQPNLTLPEGWQYGSALETACVVQAAFALAGALLVSRAVVRPGRLRSGAHALAQHDA